ncbi:MULTISPECIES: hypothetical protein [unclassified Pseudomonas]|uniref:hypothetical protein n=1 Tax=unclassified Pseudomonas TaxID=196821 RepID=UPI002096D8AE|nr:MULTISPECIES: hypothetical protein [unclassified Pseudomonas]MCO7518980.1 hypothetical protein [Pseudomonas sp. 1]MCO7541063.1 hypothetical protein [Pseudomonas sp. VA159-2]
MNTSARLLLAVLTALGIAVLSGCANHPELRPYSAEESRQLQLEALQRQGLSLQAYEQRRLALLRAEQPQEVTDVAANARSTRG